MSEVLLYSKIGQSSTQANGEESQSIRLPQARHIQRAGWCQGQ